MCMMTLIKRKKERERERERKRKRKGEKEEKGETNFMRADFWRGRF